jgi:pimeloyl-ACP methyl ester carboxylesterase
MTSSPMVVGDPARRVRLEVLVEGTGEDVVLVPSALRGADDFALLQSALAGAGYRSLAVHPRGAGRSTGPTKGLSLRDIADDVALVVTELGAGRAHLVGHALGNIVVRATASHRPDVAATVTVMPCGGHDLGAHPVPAHVLAAFARCHDMALSDEERLEALRVAFFAPGNDPRSWLDGWWPTQAISDAAIGADPGEWWRAGTVPILILHPIEDAMASVEAAREAAASLGERATCVEVPRCGHASLPEQPETIARHIIQFLRAHPLADGDRLPHP